MKGEFLKFLLVGIIILFVGIAVKNLFFPRGIISFVLSLWIAIAVGLYISKKYKEIEK
ncbi:hypothetical protein MARBORIA2_11690 [Methanobrevibacter arboriphilus]|uniref:hypothetical protein n=1 Tax=Methanobrevibacter arboriphilus TaxID=39441 RepID=UPI0022ED6422|nr:hypothetical protein [Methanobrevibacter arboriphilus]GLI12079.1 hypothetical protein MARBORIA2_11690 [Methanobrevibacter arboriphilus]